MCHHSEGGDAESSRTSKPGREDGLNWIRSQGPLELSTDQLPLDGIIQITNP